MASRVARCTAARTSCTATRISDRLSLFNACSACSESAVSGVRNWCAALATNDRCASAAASSFWMSAFSASMSGCISAGMSPPGSAASVL